MSSAEQPESLPLPPELQGMQPHMGAVAMHLGLVKECFEDPLSFPLYNEIGAALMLKYLALFLSRSGLTVYRHERFGSLDNSFYLFWVDFHQVGVTAVKNAADWMGWADRVQIAYWLRAEHCWKTWHPDSEAAFRFETFFELAPLRERFAWPPGLELVPIMPAPQV